MRYRIRLSYDGGSLSGWQAQNNAATVQGLIDSALSIVLNREIQTVGAGRTDAGVNAVNYVAHFDAPVFDRAEAARFVYKMNAILPKSIVIHGIEAEGDDFHARFGATLREYHYFIHRKKDPFSEKYSWLCRYPLDVEAMNMAAELLKGTKDFSCFEKVGGGNKTSVCTVSDALWMPYRPTHVQVLGYPYEEGDYLVFRIRADRFLRNMVRAVVGSLVEVGRGRKKPEWIGELIEGGRRGDAGESVPGHALFLSDIRY